MRWPIEALGRSKRIDFLFEAVERALGGLGVAGVTMDSVVVAPHFYDGEVLLRGSDEFTRFSWAFAFELGFIAYEPDDVAFLTVRELCEQYLEDSYPDPPETPLADGRYRFETVRAPAREAEPARDFPICFVLGCPRSGTTLLRAMLNAHESVWAPGELNLANFATMSERAARLTPRLLRYIVIPELAARLDEPVRSFATRFRGWERADLLTSDVYARLHDADTGTLIVDKTPGYSSQLATLEQIGARFRDAKFVHLVRNPHDVIRSYVRMQLYRGQLDAFEPGLNPYQMGEIVWLLHNSNIAAYLRDVPDDRKCTVRYEDLVADPEEQLTRICNVLGLGYDRAISDPYATVRGTVASGAGDMYVNTFTQVERRVASDAFFPLGRRCHELAREYDY